eukprot:COSAG06_NODE_23044_length_704_cov_1.046281_1_plen_198_part_10
MYSVSGAPSPPQSATSRSTVTTSVAAHDAAAASLLTVLNPITGWGAEAVESPPRARGKLREPSVDVFGPNDWLDRGSELEDVRAGARTDHQRGRSGEVTPTEHKDAVLETRVLELRKIAPGPGVPQDREAWQTVSTGSRDKDAERLAADHSLFLASTKDTPSPKSVKRDPRAAAEKAEKMVKWQREKDARIAREKAEK